MDSWGSQDILPGFGRSQDRKRPGDPRSNRGESVKIFEGLPGNFLKKFPWVTTLNNTAVSVKAQFLRGARGTFS
jgi:hypothetical protein